MRTSFSIKLEKLTSGGQRKAVISQSALLQMQYKHDSLSLITEEPRGLNKPVYSRDIMVEFLTLTPISSFHPRLWCSELWDHLFVKLWSCTRYPMCQHFTPDKRLPNQTVALETLLTLLCTFGARLTLRYNPQNKLGKKSL